MKKILFITVLLLVSFAFLASAPAEDCIPFNPDNCQVSLIGGNYKIVDGSMWLLDFGNNKVEADKALEIIKHYHFNSQCFVGRPNPSMEYWLVNGSAPSGSLSGEDCISFNPANIEVSFVGGNWKIVEGSHWILDFGQSKAEADEAFAVIKKYGFSEICYVGRPGPSLTYFKGTGVVTPPTVITPIGPVAPIGPIFPPVVVIPMPPADQDCITHNVDNLTVTFVGGAFKIVDGSHWLLDFGLNVIDAKRSLDIIKYYRMDSHCFVGRPNPPFEYWLVAGAAPSGDVGGEDCVSFNPNTIEVKYVSGRWKIVDGSHWMFDFDQNQGNAKKAYDIIKYYGFTKICYVGRPNPKFIYLKK
jgi:hypothetical protein